MKPDITTQIVLETLTGLILGILGASLNAPALKEITWASEMQKQYVRLPLPLHYPFISCFPQQN